MRDQAERLREMIQDVQARPQSAVIKQADLAAPAKARVITVTSGKGGVGKTNLTVNLAIALARMGQKVLIIDADLGMANVDVVLGTTAPYSIMNLLDGMVSVADIIADGPHGIKFMSGGSGMYHLANLSETELQYLISKITLFDSWADIILVDTGAGLSRNVLKFVIAADEVVLITTPEPTAITDAYAMIKAYAAHAETANLQLVVNRILDKEEGQFVVNKLLHVASRFLGTSITNLGFIYEDRNMMRAVKQQAPLLDIFPDSVSARCIEHIAYRLLYGETDRKSGGIKGFLQKFLELMR